jgi:hypothetical protein
VSVLVEASALMAASTPTRALDDRDFCSAAKQFAIAAEQDVGLWLDRVTRNGGMEVWCDRKMVVFKRFTYAPSASMTVEWKAQGGGVECDSLRQPAVGRSHSAGLEGRLECDGCRWRPSHLQREMLNPLRLST